MVELSLELISNPLELEKFNSTPGLYLDCLRDASTDQVYELILKLQIMCTSPQDLRFLDGEISWQKAEKVLDMGCGPGFLTEAISKAYPQKTYMGIDSNPSFIAAAKGRLANSRNSQFVTGDAYEFSGSYDFIIARALLQHLKDLPKFFKNARGLLNPGGVLLIIEAADHLTKEVPSIPTSNEMDRQHRSLQKSHTGDRNVAAEVESKAETLGFNVLRSEKISISSRTPQEKDLFVRMTLVRSELVSRMFGVNINKLELCRDLANWMGNTGSFAETGMSRLLLD